LIIEKKRNQGKIFRISNNSFKLSFSFFCSKNSNLNNCRIIPIHGECTCVDPRLRSKVRQLVLERLSNNDLIDRNEVLEELDHLVESHGRRLY
jgi:hypothetical protein